MNMNVVIQIITARRKTVVLLVVLVLLDVGLYLLHSVYQAPQLASLQNGVFAARRALSGGLPQDAETVYRQGTADLAAWDKRISPKREFARFLGDLFELARNNTLTMGGITYKPSLLKGERLLAYSVSFNVSGKYGQVKSFIADISRMRDIAVIDAISLNSSKLTEEYVNMKLDMTAYFRMEGR
jgi:type IV pilus assembly protein PilO